MHGRLELYQERKEGSMHGSVHLATAVAVAAIVVTAPATAAMASDVAGTPDSATVLVVPHGYVPTQPPSRGVVVVPTVQDAQLVARELSGESDVKVELTPGTYRLSSPLVFTAADSGRDGHTITWTSVSGGTAVISGGERVNGWQSHDQSKNIWSAYVGVGADTRQLYVDGVAADRARVQVSRSDVHFTAQGMTIVNPDLAYLSTLPNQSAIELESLGSFTDRYSPVESISGDSIVMQQPAWDNNTWGYDTLPSPYNGGNMYLENAYAFLQPGQWYLDSNAGMLYYRAPQGQTMAHHDVELPRLESLVQISGTYDNPVHNLTFSNLRFAHTTWLQPSSDQGYTDQQSGAHIVGTYQRPDDALTSCQNGCPQFEATRNKWWQIPAAVQVSAAHDIAFRDDTFAQLGEVGMGVGNDADANASGIGLGTQDVTIDHNRFTQDAASAIVVGGIQPDAHHPSNPAMTIADVTITNNLIDSVSRDYKDSAAILSTYADHAVISHNSLSNLPYDGIDIGWGWGINDPGGNAYYLKAGLYNYQPIYQTPTTAKNDVVSENLIHDTKTVFYDGGSIYNLSASPGTTITRNYIYNNHKTFGVLLDQGTRYVQMSQNVLVGCSNWVYVNADTKNVDTFHTMDNLINRNWFDVGTAHAPNGPGYNNIVVDNVQVTDDTWPTDAQAVMAGAGVQPES